MAAFQVVIVISKQFQISNLECTNSKEIKIVKRLKWLIKIEKYPKEWKFNSFNYF